MHLVVERKRRCFWKSLHCTYIYFRRHNTYKISKHLELNPHVIEYQNLKPKPSNIQIQDIPRARIEFDTRCTAVDQIFMPRVCTTSVAGMRWLRFLHSLRPRTTSVGPRSLNTRRLCTANVAGTRWLRFLHTLRPRTTSVVVTLSPHATTMHCECSGYVTATLCTHATVIHYECRV